jgi:hypothetical protein
VLNRKDADLAHWACMLDKKQLPEDGNFQLTLGMIEVRKLSLRHQLNKRDDLQILCLSECEQGFLQINLIISPTKSSLKSI